LKAAPGSGLPRRGEGHACPEPRRRAPSWPAPRKPRGASRKRYAFPQNRDLDLALACLADRLRTTGVNAEAVRRCLGASSPDDVGLLNHAAALERLRHNEDPAATLLRLLFLETSEPAPRLRRLIPPDEQRLLARVGLLSIARGGVRARLRLDCVGPLWLLADRRFRSPDKRALRLPPGDMVYPPGGDSTLLADVIARFRGERVLDLCTGSGVQGLIAAPNAAEVVGVDISRRAAALASINARLNQVANFTARHGDLFGPVRGETFDLVIANPPFVPGPQRGPSYHSGGPRGDRVLHRVVGGFARHLNDKGHAVVISHLALRHGEDVAGVVRPWLGDWQGRMVALVLESGSPVDLAAAQSLFALEDGLAAYAREVARWVAYLERQGIAKIVLLLLVAENATPPCFEVQAALQRTLPLPLSRPPAELVAEWIRSVE
jgi:methylase of polypeptide subunit release factors